MPDTYQDPADITAERTALQRENKALKSKLTATRAALQAVEDFMSTPLGDNPDPAPIVRLVTHTLNTTSHA